MQMMYFFTETIKKKEINATMQGNVYYLFKYVITLLVPYLGLLLLLPPLFDSRRLLAEWLQ